MKTTKFLGALLLLAITLPGLVHGQANSWTNGTGGKWELGANWSLAVPPSSAHSAIFITNGVTSKFETIDAVTTNTVSTTVSNLTVSAPGIFNNFLLLRTASLAIRNTFTISAGGNVSISNSLLSFASSGRGLLNNGNLTLINGTINSFAIETNHIGSTASGQMLIQDGTWFDVWHVTVGANTGARGTLTISGGTVSYDTAFTSGSRDLTIGAAAASTGTVWLTGGNLSVLPPSLLQADLYVGLSGVGEMTASNGTWVCYNLHVAENSTSLGTLTMAGGTCAVSNNFTIGQTGGTGTVWMTGGQLAIHGITGINAGGQMTMSNGISRSRYSGFDNFINGTLTMVGGTNTIDLSLGINGSVWLKGGDFFTTNVALNSGLLNIAGQMTVSNGTWHTTNVFISAVAGNRGTLTIAGGTNILQGTTMRLGLVNSSTGTVVVSGGLLFVTNASNTASISVLTGTFTMNGGSVFADRLSVVRTNAGFILNGGEFTCRATAITNGQVFGVGGVGNSATLNLIGTTHSFSNGVTIASAAGSTGTVWMSATQLLLTNVAETAVGGSGVGQMTVSNGTWLARDVNVGEGVGAQGTLTLAGGTNNFSSSLNVGYFGTGTCWMTGGRLAMDTANANIGLVGPGQMTVTGGTWRILNLFVGGSAPGSLGTLTLAGGATTVLGFLGVGNTSNPTQTVWMTGGLLVTTNALASIGSTTAGRMTVSNGTWRAVTTVVGANTGSRGTLTIAGGTNLVSDNLILGKFDCTATGTVAVTSGELRVTNSTADANLEVQSGTFTMSGGTVVVDNFVITNACAHFVRTGGTLLYNNAVLVSTRDDDGDGIPNGSDLDPLDPADAGNDPDGDGFTNLQEFQARTNPTNSTSYLGITSISQIATNILVTWQAGTGSTNALQRTPGTAGNYDTNGFTTIFTATNIVGTATNYLDVGAATNSPANFYRVRLVP